MAVIGNEQLPRKRDNENGRMGSASFTATHRDETEQIRNMGGSTPRAGGSGAAMGGKVTKYQGENGYAPAAPATPTGGGGYSSNPAEAQANALYQQLMNRGPFRYDLQGDMLYRQYADQYSQLGRQAMMDTMGTAAGLTGGYASSNAQLLGQQANNQYLMQLNAMVPDFYDRAYQAWQDQGEELYNKYQLAMSKVPSRAAAPAATEQTAVAVQPAATTVQPTYAVTGLDGIFGNLANALLQDPEFDYYLKYLNAQKGEK